MGMEMAPQNPGSPAALRPVLAPGSSALRPRWNGVGSEDPHLPEGRVHSGVNSYSSKRFYVFIRGPVGISTIYINPDVTVSDLNGAFYNKEGIKPKPQHLMRSDGRSPGETDRQLTSYGAL